MKHICPYNEANNGPKPFRIFAVFWLVALMVSVALFGARSSARAEFDTSYGKIVFESDRDDNGEIYTANSDGSQQTNLTRNEAEFDEDPSWSPDGSRIAFASNRYGGSDVFVVNQDGTDLTLLTKTRNKSDSYGYSLPSWSPDGSKITFDGSKRPNEPSDIFVVNRDGTNLISLTKTKNKNDNFSPSWSPDSKSIVFVNGRRQGGSSKYGGIYVMNSDGSNQRKLASSNASRVFHSPSWSPDGSKVAFLSGDSNGGSNEIVLMNPDGTGLTKLTQHQDDFDYSWSPDGTKIVFARYIDKIQSNRIFVVDTSSGVMRKIPTGKGNVEHPSWSPNGTKIAFDDNDDNRYGSIWTVDVDGKNRHRIITTRGARNVSPSWQPVTTPQAAASEITSQLFDLPSSTQ